MHRSHTIETDENCREATIAQLIDELTKPDKQYTALAALSSLLSHESDARKTNVAAIVEADGIPRLITLLNELDEADETNETDETDETDEEDEIYGMDEEDQALEDITLIISELTLENTDNQRQIQEAGAIPALITRLGSEITTVAFYSALALGNLAEGDPESRDLIRKHKGIDLLIQLLEHIDCGYVGNAIWALKNLMIGNTQNQIAIQSSAARQLLVKIFTNEGAHKHEQQAAWELVLIIDNPTLIKPLPKKRERSPNLINPPSVDASPKSASSWDPRFSTGSPFTQPSAQRTRHENAAEEREGSEERPDAEEKNSRHSFKKSSS